MKQYFFPLEPWFCKKHLKPIRDKRSLLSLLIQTIKLMLVSEYSEEQPNDNHVTLCVSKMSRLIYEVDGKVFSYNFPFLVRPSHDGRNTIEVVFQNLCLVDSKLTSLLLPVIDDETVFHASNIGHFESVIFEIEETSPNVWPVLHLLLTFEDGYIRYDHDEIRFDKQKPHRHPIDHYDVFYSSNSTFKLGLDNVSSKSQLMDMLNTDSDCHYVQEK